MDTSERIRAARSRTAARPMAGSARFSTSPNCPSIRYTGLSDEVGS